MSETTLMNEWTYRRARKGRQCSIRFGMVRKTTRTPQHRSITTEARQKHVCVVNRRQESKMTSCPQFPLLPLTVPNLHIIAILQRTLLIMNIKRPLQIEAIRSKPRRERRRFVDRRRRAHRRGEGRFRHVVTQSLVALQCRFGVGHAAEDGDGFVVGRGLGLWYRGGGGHAIAGWIGGDV